jgi:polysaccharide transporter, PST family
MLIAQSINSCAMVLSFVAGLPYGPVGVAIAFSVSSLVIRVPIIYFMVGRRGPVRTADLWGIFFRHLPIWIVVFFVTWFTLALVATLTPLVQLLVCVPVGVLTGAAFICSFAPQRQVAVYLLATWRELKRTRKFAPQP